MCLVSFVWCLVQGLACVFPTDTFYLYVLGNVQSVVHVSSCT